MMASLLRNAGILALACGLAAPAQAASSTVAVRYALSIIGLPIGSATLTASLADNGPYSVTVAAKIGGILSLVSDGRGSATASGRMGGAQPSASGYAINSISAGKQQTVQMALAGGAVTTLVVKPEFPFRPDRIPVTPADKRGVIDPVSALLMPVPVGSNALAPAACNRTLPVFDGGQRFDVALTYARMETIDTQGYKGAAVACAARYTPLAGHRPTREQTKFMAQNRDMEVWLAPVGSTHVLAPMRIVIGTQVGRLVIDAAKVTATGAAQ